MDELSLPLRTTVLFAHSIVQAIADEVGADILHIKGPAIEPQALGVTATRPRRQSVDADVLVRPSHVGRLLHGMRAHGWSVLYDFRGGSPFEHATTLGREGVANVDVHRYFPGIEADPEAVFSTLWADRRTMILAACPVQVPSLPAQRLILILHAARQAGVAQSADVEMVWGTATPAARSDITALADRLRAHVGLAAGTGTLETVKGERSYALWAALSKGETSQVRLWRARVRAAPNRREALRTALHLLGPNLSRMTANAGRPLTAGERLRAYWTQGRRGFAALALARRNATSRGRSE